MKWTISPTERQDPVATTVRETRSGAATEAKQYPIYVAGEWQAAGEPLEVRSPYSGDVIGVTFQASRDQLEQAIVAAERAFEITRVMPTYERSALLKAMAAGLKTRRDEIAQTIAAEAGKPIRDAEVETDRGVFTLETAAEEAKRIDGEVIPLDLLPSSKGRVGIVRRFPIGPIAGISPFNFPLEPGPAQNRAGHRLRQHDRAQAAVARPADDAPLRRDHRGGRRARRALSASCRWTARWATLWSRIRASSSSPSPARPTSAGK